MSKSANQQVILQPLKVTPAVCAMLSRGQQIAYRGQQLANRGQQIENRGQEITNNFQDISPMYNLLVLNKTELATTFIKDTPKNPKSRVKRRLLCEFEANGEHMTVEEEIRHEEGNGTAFSASSDDDLSFNPNFVISSNCPNSGDLSDANLNDYIPLSPQEHTELDNVKEIENQERQYMNIQEVEKMQTENEAVNGENRSSCSICFDDLSDANQNYYIPLLPQEHTELDNVKEIENQERQYMHIQEVKKMLTDNEVANSEIQSNCSSFDDLSDANQNYYIPLSPQEHIELHHLQENEDRVRLQYTNIEEVEKIQTENEVVSGQIRTDSRNIVSASDVTNETAFEDQVLSMSINGQNLKHNVELEIPEVGKIQYDHAAEEKVLSADGGRKTRRQFCLFCKKLVAKLPNHVEALHKQETPIQQLLSYPKGHAARHEILKTLRRKGAEEYNGNRLYNGGILMPARRPKVEQKGDNFLPCAKCSQLIQARRLHRHYKRCNNSLTPTAAVDRHCHALAKKKQANIHIEACDILKDRVMPFMRVDKFSNAIRFDRLAVAYGNSMCFKYATSSHHDLMIRSHLRFLGRILLEARALNSSITSLQSLFTPVMHDTVVKAIQNIAGFAPMTGSYRAPSTASMLAMIIKKLTYIWETQCINANDVVALKLVNNFRTLFVKISYPQISKTVEENRIKLQRRKNVKLPSLEDINKLASFLQKNCVNLTKKLQQSKKFNYTTWKELGAHLMGAILLLNRRRPGEMQRIEIEDYKAVIQIDEHHPEYEALCIEEKELASKLQLFVIRGKLNRSVQVILHDWMKASLEVFLAHRNKAGVPDTNRYVFGIPGGGGLRHMYLNIGKYIREFAEKCGAADPTSLRATILRKHLATKSAAQHSSNDSQIQNLANHLGHADYIHKNIYTQKGINKNLLQVVKLLQNAQGDNQQQTSYDNETFINISNSQNSSHLKPNETNNERTQQIQDNSLGSSNDIDNSVSSQGLPLVVLQRIQEPQSLDKSTLKNSKTVLVKKRKASTSQYNFRQSNKQNRVLQKSSSESEKDYSGESSEEYNKSDSDSESSSDSKYEQQVQKQRKRKRTPSKHGKQFLLLSQNRTPQRMRQFKYREVVHRRRWSPESLGVLKSAFSTYLADNSLPSMTDIRAAKLQHPVLQPRKTPVIKAAISNMLKRLHPKVN